MADLTTMELSELISFADSLELFTSNISSRCSNMEDNISDCYAFMRDEKSQKSLKDAAQVCMDIRETLSPAQMLLDKVLRMIDEIVKNNTLG